MRINEEAKKRMEDLIVL